MGGQGEERAWDLLSGLDPADVCVRTLADHDSATGSYTVRVFNIPVRVTPVGRTFEAHGAGGDWLLGRMGYFSRLSILHYMVGAKAVPPVGRLVKPVDLKGGALYYAGSHVLPLPALAARYGGDAAAFLAQGQGFGGVKRSLGDVAVELVPFPRLPVTLVFWRGDDEFEARADLLFDATADQHVPPDIVWSIAMFCVKAMVPASSGK